MYCNISIAAVQRTYLHRIHTPLNRLSRPAKGSHTLDHAITQSFEVTHSAQKALP